MNGVSASCSFLSRILSPIICGYVLSWTCEQTRSFPLNYHLIFLTLALAVVVSLIFIAFVPKSFDKQLERNNLSTNQSTSTSSLTDSDSTNQRSPSPSDSDSDSTNQRTPSPSGSDSDSTNEREDSSSIHSDHISEHPSVADYPAIA